jgi:hypothetical protein
MVSCSSGIHRTCYHVMTVTIWYEK